jgi:hypothetical protein
MASPLAPWANPAQSMGVTCDLMRRWGACLVLAGTVACGDDGSPGIDDAGTTSNITGISTADPDDGTSTGEAPDDSGGTTVVADDTGDGGTMCETILCGDPAECCGADEECVLAGCLPVCDSGVRCGEDQSVCCDDGQVCLANACATPGDPCIDSYDCPEGQFCEPTLDQCLPQPDPVTCEIQPEFGALEPLLEWSHESDQVITAPAVGDVDGDGLPEVVINTMWAVDPGGGTAEFFGEIVVLDGTNGEEQTRISNSPPESYGSYARSSMGIADVDGNNLPDIVYVGRPTTNIPPFANNSSRIHAVNGLGQTLWSSHDAAGAPYYIYVRQGAPAFANFDDDDASEIVFGTAVLDNDGLVVFDQDDGSGLGGGVYGTNAGVTSGGGGISIIADLTGDGYPEIISGHEAWTVDWDDPPVGNPTVELTLLWADDTRPDGYPAIADLDLDGDPEVVVVADGTVRVLDGATGQLWCGIDPTGAMCTGNDALRTQPIVIPGDPAGRGGPPTIADFDGDGLPEIAVAGGSSYSVYDLYRQGEDVVQPGGFPPAQMGEIFVRWTSATQDLSSNATGSSVFDFQGDGTGEVLYGDECYFRVYDGPSGDVLLEIENPSATIREYPIVVDVDDDGNSEIVVVANDINAINTACVPNIPGYTTRHGVFVYGDTNDQWVGTRQVWTQHSYHITNATSTGLVPATEEDNWTAPGLNNYRQNSQGEGIFNAPDLTVDLAVGTSTCLDEMFVIVATVRNVGALGVPAGVPVTLYQGMDATGTLVSVQMTPGDLLPGASVDLLWQVPAPGGTPLNFFVEVDDDVATAISECEEGNNTAATESVACPIPG